MRFLADENFPGSAAMRLEAAGHDVVSVRSAAPGSTDAEIVAWAAREQRIILTFDKDFGELARSAEAGLRPGVILFRIPMPMPADAGALLAARIDERSDWLGHFSVIEPGRVRMRRLE